MLWLYRFFCGYITIAIKGNYSERLINTLAKSGISVWHIKRKKNYIQASIFAHDFKRLASLKGKSGVKIHILSKTGLPFVINKYKHRPGLFAGAALFIVLIFVLSSYVWNIKVEGNKAVSEQTVIEACKRIGIKEGTKTKDVDPQNARVELLLEMKGLTWASINVEGSCVTVNVREYEEKQKDDDAPCNLKSAVSGVVISTKVTKGDVCVKPGDTVTKDQLLVSGAVAHADGTTQFVKSQGEIIVETTRTFVQKINFEQEQCIRNGKVKTLSVINFFGHKIPLFLGEIKGDYEKENKICKLSAGANYAPIYLEKANFYMIKTDRYRLSVEQAIEKAQKSIENEVLSIDGFSVVSHKDEILQNEDGIELKREYICRENAAKSEILLIDTFN